MKVVPLIALAAVFQYALCAASEGYAVPTYDIVSAGVGAEGTSFVKVTVELPKPDKDVEANLLIAAVHGVIFKGVGSSEKGVSQRPIVGDISLEQQHSDFFTPFFSSQSQYGNYASIINGSIRVVKAGKKKYLVSASVIVKRDNLRRLLEQRKIIEGFTDMF